MPRTKSIARKHNECRIEWKRRCGFVKTGLVRRCSFGKRQGRLTKGGEKDAEEKNGIAIGSFRA
jgi:hypothetical protein